MPAFLRERSRSNEILVHYHFHDSSGALADGISKFTNYVEYISDVVGKKAGVNPCSHLRVDSSPREEVLTVTLPSGYVFHTNFTWNLPEGFAGLVFPDPSSSLIGDLSDKAYEALVPQVPQEVSIPNFLYELREISALLPSLSEGIGKTASGGFLNYSFGWKPFIGDVQKLRSLMNIVNSRLEYLRDTWGRETRISYQTDFNVEGSVTGTTVGFPDTIRRVSSRGIFRCGGYLYHELQDLDGLIGEFRGLLAATGFNNPLAVLWEAIPFSFVADWFTRAGSLISRTPIQPFVGPWEIRRLTHSYEIEGTFDVLKTFDGGASPSQAITHTGVYRRYIREVGLPVSSAVLHADGLSPQQQALGAALILSGSKHS